MAGGFPYVRDMIREAVAALGSPTTNVAVRNWVEQRYPGTNRGTIGAQRTICTVNQPSRVHYSENERLGIADDDRYDFLYCPARGRLEWYRPERHGVWSIERDDEGRFAICCDDGELVYPQPRGHPKTTVTERPPAREATPVTEPQVEAAKRLHARLTKWSSTDRAFGQLAERFPGWDREACILKTAAINDLYSTRVYAIWRMAEHLADVMQAPPTEPAHLVEAIASLPGPDGKQVERQHWSFASKVCHFFVDGERFPIYDSFCRDLVAHHLGRGGCVSDPTNPYRAFMANLERLRKLSGISPSLRDMDRYLWLAGQYREWRKKGEQAQINTALRALFEDPSPRVQQDLSALLTPDPQPD